MSKLLKYYGINVAEGEYLFQEGDTADYLYMIYKGEVLIHRIVNGVEEKIKVLEEGEFVGEMAIIDSKPRSANARALTDCQLIKMTKDSFEKNFKKNPQLGMSFLRFLTTRIRDTNEIVSFMLTRNRNQFFSLHITREILKTGKKDSTGKWYLLDYKAFVEKMESLSSYTQHEIEIIIDELCEPDEMKIVTSQNGVRWIASQVE